VQQARDEGLIRQAFRQRDIRLSSKDLEAIRFRMPLTPPSQGLGGDRQVADVATE
jgi:hypothetical protein